VADQEDRSGIILQSVFQSFDGLHIQVVGGLVQGQKVCLCQRNQGQGHPRSFPPGKGIGEAANGISGEPEASQVSLDLATFLYASATVIGAPSPGGMGLADASLAEGALVLVPGIDAGQAMAAALLVRIATLWFGVTLGAFALLRIDGVIRRARSDQPPSSTQAGQ